MAFFESASEYNINGGNFHKVHGDINKRYHDNSVKIDGQGNSVTYHHGSYQNGSGSNITNNNSGRMTIIGQGDNARIHLSHFDFPGNNGIFQMPQYPQVHVSMPQNDSRYAAPPYPPRDSQYFDPRMGYPQQYAPQRTMYQPTISHVNQFPMAHESPTAAYAAGPINMTERSYYPSDWNEPPGTRSNVTTEYSVDSSSFYNPAAPLSSPLAMPVPSPARASTPLQIPSSVPVPVPLPTPAPVSVPPPSSPPAPTQAPTPTPPPLAPTSLQMPMPPPNDVTSNLTITSHQVAPPFNSSPNFPQERATTPLIPHSSIHHTARHEVRESPSSDLSHNTTSWNFTAPYPHRAVDQIHAHETAHRHDEEVSVPHSATSNNSIEERSLCGLERVSSPSSSISHRSSSMKRPLESETPQKSQLSSQPNYVTSESTSIASTSTPVAVVSSPPEDDRLPAHPQPSEKTIRGIQEVELSVESMPPPAYSLEPETPIQTGEISQEPVAVINSPSSTGLENQEDRYSPSGIEVVGQEENYMPDIVVPKRKKKSWRFTDLFRRGSKRNTGPVVEL